MKTTKKKTNETSWDKHYFEPVKHSLFNKKKHFFILEIK